MGKTSYRWDLGWDLKEAREVNSWEWRQGAFQAWRTARENTESQEIEGIVYGTARSQVSLDQRVCVRESGVRQLERYEGTRL